MNIINRMNVLEALKDLYDDRLGPNNGTNYYINSGIKECIDFNNCGFTCSRYAEEVKVILDKYKGLNYEYANNEVKEEIENTLMNFILLAYVGSKYYLDNNTQADNYQSMLIVFKYLNYLIDSFNYKITNPDDYSLIDIEKTTN